MNENKKRQEEEFRKKQIYKHLRFNEAMENAKRISYLRKSQERKILEKIEQEEERLAQIQKEKEDAIKY